MADIVPARDPAHPSSPDEINLPPSRGGQQYLLAKEALSFNLRLHAFLTYIAPIVAPRLY